VSRCGAVALQRAAAGRPLCVRGRAANLPDMRRSPAFASPLLVALLAGCAHPPPPPVPPPSPVPPAANPIAPVVSPRQAAGYYQLTTSLPVTRDSRSRSRRTRPARGLLRLGSVPLAAPDPTATSGTQLDAAVSIPGYTVAPPGRVAQAAAWWPLPGDTVIVHFQTPRGDGVMELRGTLQSDTLAGEVWFTSAKSGSTYEMGTFLGVKRRRR
jgi:hypothetical protein